MVEYIPVKATINGRPVQAVLIVPRTVKPQDLQQRLGRWLYQRREGAA